MQRKEAFPPTTRSLAYLIRTVRRAVDQGTVKTIFRRSGKCFKIPELFFFQIFAFVLFHMLLIQLLIFLLLFDMGSFDLMLNH